MGFEQGKTQPSLWSDVMSMMPRAVTFVALSLVIVWGAGKEATGQEEKNLVLNPGFEDVKDGKPAHWTTGGISQGGKGTLAISTEKPKTGKHCARITGEAEWATFGCSRIAIMKGKKYELKGWVRAVKGQGYVKFDYMKDNEFLGMTMNQMVDSNDWTEMTITSETDTHSTATHLIVSLVGQGDFEVYFDDISVVEKK
jgi:hypothetical protein